MATTPGAPEPPPTFGIDTLDKMRAASHARVTVPTYLDLDHPVDSLDAKVEGIGTVPLYGCHHGHTFGVWKYEHRWFYYEKPETDSKPDETLTIGVLYEKKGDSRVATLKEVNQSLVDAEGNPVV